MALLYNCRIKRCSTVVQADIRHKINLITNLHPHRFHVYCSCWMFAASALVISCLYNWSKIIRYKHNIFIAARKQLQCKQIFTWWVKVLLLRPALETCTVKEDGADTHHSLGILRVFTHFKQFYTYISLLQIWKLWELSPLCFCTLSITQVT